MWTRIVPPLPATGSAEFPALLIFKGGKVSEQIVGVVPKASIEQAISKVVDVAAVKA